jgi:hypothetical protein
MLESSPDHGGVDDALFRDRIKVYRKLKRVARQYAGAHKEAP